MMSLEGNSHRNYETMQPGIWSTCDGLEVTPIWEFPYIGGLFGGPYMRYAIIFGPY